MQVIIVDTEMFDSLWMQTRAEPYKNHQVDWVQVAQKKQFVLGNDIANPRHIKTAWKTVAAD